MPEFLSVLSRRRTLLALLACCLFLPWGWALAQEPEPSPPAADVVVAAADAAPAPVPPSAKAYYGWWVVTPALVAILLAVATRQVVPSLIVSILTGAYMVLPCIAPADSFRSGPDAGLFANAIAGIRLSTEKFLLSALLDPFHLKIIIFTLSIGFLVGVIGRNGGTTGMVNLVTGATKSRRRTAIAAWLAGCVVFFDDYANAMIIGPTMRPVFDKMKMSRAKLAYIVDSTAAPVASIAIIGTWVGTEVGYIGEGLSQVKSQMPAFLAHSNEMTAFLNSIPYRFYPILALLLGILLAATGRDFGPMLRSEALALSDRSSRDDRHVTMHDGPHAPPRWWLGFVPIGLLVAITLVVLFFTGYTAEGTVKAMAAPEWASTPWWSKASKVVGSSDSYIAIMYGAFGSATVAVLLSLVCRACSLQAVFESGIDGLVKMMPAIVILVLAWALSDVSKSLELGQVVADKLQQAQFPPNWLPFIVFVASALISFATGSSWGTMGILCPLVVVVAVKLIGDVPPERAASALSLFHAAVAAVLSGSVFGDHCSPISDTTVLSSLSSGCPHEEHVWTQLPYALVVAVIAMFLGDMLCSVLDLPWEAGMIATALATVVVVFALGRRPEDVAHKYVDTLGTATVRERAQGD